MRELSVIVLDARNPSPLTGRGNNTYLIVGADRRATLIDAGIGDPEHLAEIDQQLAVAGARLDRVLVTHGHSDHASGAPALAAAYPDADFAKYPWPAEDARYRVVWESLSEGQTIPVGGDSIRVVHTPGHSPDHVVFWHEASRAAFTGDLLIPGGSVMINWSRGGNVADYLASIQRLLALAPATIWPAHGRRVDGPATMMLLTGCLEHRRMREGQVVAALQDGRATVQAIAESIYDGLDPALMAAARETVRAHLEMLKAEGRAREDAGRWTT